jgi:hypothetical protein
VRHAAGGTSRLTWALFTPGSFISEVPGLHLGYDLILLTDRSSD